MNEKEFQKGRMTVGQTLVVGAPAKVNLHLEVLKQRHDHYHEIETVLQAVSLFDQVRVTLVEEYPGGVPVINLAVSPAGFPAPNDQSNLCWQAARHFCKEMGVSGRLDLELAKDIPPAAGLGGGSSDAAAQEGAARSAGLVAGVMVNGWLRSWEDRGQPGEPGSVIL